MSDIRKTLDKLNEMTAGSVATVATPLFKETVKREKTDETADSGKKYMNSVERGASEWGNWAGSKKKKTVAEATNPTTDDDKFKTMLKKVTSKKEVKKQQKADTKQQASDAFASMFGGGNPAGTLGIRKEGVAEGLGKNVVKSVKVGNFRHDLVDTGMGWQVRIYNGDELYDTGLSKNSEQKGLAALEDAVAYTEKQTNTRRQGVSEGERKLGPAPGQSTPNQAERAKSRDHQRTDAAKKARDASQRKGLKQDKDGTYYAKEGVAEGDSGAKYRIKQIGKDNKGHYYISPSTGKKVYKQAKVGDHENPKTGEHMKKIKEDETMQFAAEVTPKVSPYAGIKDNKFRGAIGEESNYNPVGVQPGGWRKYKLKVNELKELGKDKKEKIAKFRKQIKDLKAKGFYKAADDVQKGFKTVFPDEKVVAETYEYLLYRYSDLLDKHDDMFVIDTIISESKHEDKKDNAKKVIKKLENTSEGQIYSTGGGAGEAQRKYKPKLSGVFEGITTSKKSINK